MKITAIESSILKVKADAVAILLPEDKGIFGKETSKLRKLLGACINEAVELEKFTGKEGQILSLFSAKRSGPKRLYLAGIGMSGKLSLEKYRRAAASLANQASSSHVKRLAVSMPEFNGSNGLPKHEVAGALAEGAFLSSYRYEKYITDKKNLKETIRELIIIDRDALNLKNIKRHLSDVRTVCEAVFTARDLENAPASEIYPETLAEAAKKSAERYGFKATVWDRKKIQEAGLGGLLGVSSGSNREPRFIILEYKPASPETPIIVLVGKGVTFDSGGISIKPASGMAEMKMDMSGAAAVIATFEAASRLKLPVRLVGLIPCTENMPGGSSMRPGDIIKHYGGKTSEVDNTDAEGRLILADALAYSRNYKPEAVIDLATLTGACVVALGQHATGMMGNDEPLMEKLKAAGEKTFERLWQLPLYEEYEKQIKSEIADVKNVGGRWAGAITAALFLKKFVGDQKWVHLDIAGTSILEEALPYSPKGGSGVGVRLLVEFLRNLQHAG